MDAGNNPPEDSVSSPDLKTSQPTTPISPINALSDIEFANDAPSDPTVDRQLSEIAMALLAKGADVNPFVLDYFGDPRFFNSLPSEVRGNNQLLSEYIANMSKFYGLVGKERIRRATGDKSGLFAEDVELPESTHADGRTRRAENGHRVNVDYLRSAGIDPSKVLLFRLTQPMGDKPKPEYYWTSDFHEPTKGLTQEVSPEQRARAIILVDSLDRINGNGGLIQDINDDSGISVRQIGTGSYDQNGAIASFKAVQ